MARSNSGRRQPVARVVELAAVASLLACASGAMGQGYLYAIDRNNQRYSIDRSTAVATPIVDDADWHMETPGGVTFVPELGPVLCTRDQLYYVEGGYQSNFEFPHWLASFGDAVSEMQAIEWNDADSTLYRAGNGKIFTIDLSASAAATPVGSTGLGSVLSLVYDSTNDVMYMTSGATNALYSLDVTTATPTLIGSLNGPTSPSALAYVPDDDAIYLVCNKSHASDTLYTIDRATGAATAIGDTGTTNIRGLVWVPEPALNCAPCAADYDNNGGVDGADLGAFFADFERGRPCADIDQNGGVDGGDLGLFFQYFEGGCC